MLARKYVTVWLHVAYRFVWCLTAGVVSTNILVQTTDSKPPLSGDGRAGKEQSEFSTGSVMDRKYKQRGYQEDSSEGVRRERRPQSNKTSGIRQYGMRNGGTARSGIRCARCGKTISGFSEVLTDSICGSCGSDLHTCTNCANFNTSSRWECTKPILTRVSPKDSRNDCAFFSATVFVERTFESVAAASPQEARKAFDALFKK